MTEVAFVDDDAFDDRAEASDVVVVVETEVVLVPG